MTARLRAKAQGPRGAQGNPGANGLDGPPGPIGPTGPAGGLPGEPALIADGIKVAVAAKDATGAVAAMMDDGGRALQTGPDGTRERIPLKSEQDAAMEARVRIDIREAVPAQTLAPLLPPGRTAVGAIGDTGGRGAFLILDDGSLMQPDGLGGFETIPTRSEMQIAPRSTIINAATAERFIILSNSDAESGYGLPHKAWMNNLAAQTDWLVENISQTSNDVSELYYRFQSNLTRFGSLSPRSMAGSYVLIGDMSNGTWKNRQFTDMRTGYARLADLVRLFGAEPILFFEARPMVETMAVDYASSPLLWIGIDAMAREMGLRFWNQSDVQVIQRAQVDPDDYGYAHRGQRAQWSSCDTLLPELQALPRPTASIKLFRPRDGEAHKDDLRFETLAQRYLVWDEIEVGHTALHPSIQAYYDRLAGMPTPAYVTRTSEYQTLAGGGTIACTDRVLVEFVLPATAKGTTGLAIKPGVSGARIYAMSADIALGYNPLGGTWQAVESASLPAVSPGDVYEESVNGLTFTVSGASTLPDGRHVVSMVPFRYNSLGVVTFTKVSGLGPSSFASTRVKAGNSGAFYASLSAPWRDWVELEVVNEKVVLKDRLALQQAMIGDKITLLIEKDGAFNLSSPEIEWTGEPQAKGPARAKPALIPNATQLLTDRVIEGSTNWKSINGTGALIGDGSVTTSEPDDLWLPAEVTEVAEITATSGLRQTFTPGAHARRNVRAQIVVRCRYNPPRHEIEDDLDEAAINLTSVDVRTLRAVLHMGDQRLAWEWTEQVGLAWRDVIFEFALPTSGQLNATMTLDLYCTDGALKVGLAEVNRE